MKKLLIQGENKYPVYIKSNSYDSVAELIGNFKYSEICIIHDSKINIELLEKIHLQKYILSIEVEEKNKSIDTFQVIIDFLVRNNIKKSNTLILAVGGGVISDLVGFVSSVYMRGIDFAIIPTTVNAMVDASIGSKNGVDFLEHKNQIGTFYDPKFIIIDPKFLDTLPERQINSGIAEIIKIAFLSKIEILRLLDEGTRDWEKIIYFAINEKNKYLEKDFYDKNIRQFLNFGHTYGHALESYYNFEKYTHGEAISIGMCLAFPHEKLIKVLKKYNLPTTVDEEIDAQKLFDLMKHDKKRTNNKKVRIITLKDIENPTFTELENHFDVFKSIELLKINEKSIS